MIGFSRGLYVIVFALLAVIFVPVYSTIFAPVSMTGPCCYLIFVILTGLQWDWFAFFLKGILAAEVVIYLTLFFTLGSSTFWLSSKISDQRIRLAFQTMVLLSLFACSFLPVIHSDSFVNETGTYDFWSACARAWQIL